MKNNKKLKKFEFYCDCPSFLDARYTSAGFPSLGKVDFTNENAAHGYQVGEIARIVFLAKEYHFVVTETPNGLSFQVDSCINVLIEPVLPPGVTVVSDRVVSINGSGVPRVRKSR